MLSEMFVGERLSLRWVQAQRGAKKARWIKLQPTKQGLMQQSELSTSFLWVVKSFSYPSSFLISLRFPVQHVCHLNELTEEQLNKMLNNIVDMENLYISISRQDDMDIKKVISSIQSRFAIQLKAFRSLSGLHLPVEAPSSLHPYQESVNSHRSRSSRWPAFRDARHSENRFELSVPEVRSSAWHVEAGLSDLHWAC